MLLTQQANPVKFAEQQLSEGVSHLLDVERGDGLERLGPPGTHADGGVALKVGEVAARADKRVRNSSINRMLRDLLHLYSI